MHCRPVSSIFTPSIKEMQSFNILKGRADSSVTNFLDKSGIRKPYFLGSVSQKNIFAKEFPPKSLDVKSSESRRQTVREFGAGGSNAVRLARPGGLGALPAGWLVAAFTHVSLSSGSFLFSSALHASFLPGYSAKLKRERWAAGSQTSTIATFLGNCLVLRFPHF